MRKIKRVSPLAILLLALSFLLALTFCFLSGQSTQYDLSEGDIAPDDIYASRDIVDKLYTEELRSAAEKRVETQYTLDASVQTAAETNLSELFASLRILRDQSMVSESDVVNAETKSAITLTEEERKLLLSCSDSQFALFSERMTELVRDAYTKGIPDQKKTISDVSSAFGKESLPDKLITVADSIFPQVLRTNQAEDKEATEALKNQARNSVQNVLYKRNQVIVRKGEQVNKYQIGMLKDLGLLKDAERLPVGHMAVLLILVLLLYGIFAAYCYTFQQDMLKNTGQTFLLFLLVTGTMALSFLAIRIPEISNALIPVCLAAALVSILFDIHLAMAVHSLLCILVGILTQFDWNIAICYFLIGTVLIYLYHSAYSRTRLAIASLLCAVTGGFGVFLFSLLELSELTTAVKQGLLGVLNGLIVAVLAIGLLPILELCFDVLTPSKLIDLANPDKRLLKRILMEAPGTYHHSLTVANLAEEAAEKIGANPFLTKVAAYYHDAGKLKNPLYFKENQLADNPHDHMLPIESAGILLAHPIDGEKIAKQHHLPRAVRDIIREHHGTTTAAYFYHKACSTQGAEHVNIKDYQYQGPIPSSREAAIIMLADSCEAAVRSMDEKTPEAMEEKVRQIIQSKMTDGQLRNSNLTFRDIEIITNSFLGTLSSYFHSRISYPSDKESSHESNSNS